MIGDRSLAKPRGAGRPLVSFVMLAYNQEHLVRPAIAGALAQDYPNLEIVLSDDGSSDNTFCVFEEAARAYDGPHTIITNRTSSNAGTLKHLCDAVSRCSGDIIIVSAGDDISYQHRTARTVAFFDDNGQVDAVHAGYDLIDDSGRVLQHEHRIDSSKIMFRDYFPNRIIEPIHGASSAYRRSVFESLDLPEPAIFYEDTFLTLLLTTRSKGIGYIDEPLVALRQHEGSITNHVAGRTDREFVSQREQAQLRHAASMLAILRHFEPSLLDSINASVQARCALRDDLRLFDLRSRWPSSSFTERLAALRSAAARGQLRWLMPRLFGMGVFGRIKQLKVALRDRRRIND